MDIRLILNDVYFSCFNAHFYSSIQRLNIYLARMIVWLNYGNRPWTQYPMLKDKNRRRMALIHIPKCAGTSVANSLGWDNIRHYPASIFFLSNKNSFLDTDFFAVVRDPIDRLASILMHFEASRFSSKREKALFEEIGITEENTDDFTADLMGNKSFQRRLFIGTKAGRNGFSVDQHDYLFFKEKLLVKNLFSINQLDKLENWLSQRLGKTVLLPYNNSSNRKRGIVYNDHIVKAAKKRLTKDFLLYEMLSEAGGVILEGDSIITKIEKAIRDDER